MFVLKGLPTPDYQLPFEKDVGLHPSLEEMQVLVAKNRKRPTFPDTWKDTNQVRSVGLNKNCTSTGA